MTAPSLSITLPYVAQGARDGVPVLMLHGLSDSWRSFAPILPYLPPEVRAIVMTQRGQGDAPRPEGGYSVAGLAADAVAMLDALAIDEAVVLGHSLGSHVALRMAIDAPERVSGLVLAGCFATCRGNAVMQEFFVEAAELTDPVPRQFAYDFQVGTLHQPIAEELLEGYVDESLKLPARVWRALAESLDESHLVDELHRISAPALIVQGAHDAFFDDAVYAQVRDGLADVRVARYEHAGHAMHWEEPERFAADVAAFVTAR
jgi:pimeloyl-ACP methyl ester carboxylesterase